MRLQLAGYIDLPAHLKPGGFDHAAVHRATARLYVAHTANDAVDVLDCLDCVADEQGMTEDQPDTSRVR